MNRRLLTPLMMLAFFLGGSEFAFGLTGFVLGDAANYAVIYQAGGSNHLDINNGPGLMNASVNGNIGLANSPSTVCPTCTNNGDLQLSGPETINGNIDFSGAVHDNGPYSGNIVVNGTISGGHANVRTDMDNLTSLSSSLGAELGSSVALNSGATITANGTPGHGMLDASGNLVFTVSGISAPNGTLTINGNGINKVVFNISAAADANFHFNQIVLGGGLTSDDVLFNFFGGTNEAGGPTLDINSGYDGAHPNNIITGTFLDPNGAISIVSTRLDGRLFGGDSVNEQIVSGAQINAPPGTPVPDSGSAVALLGLALAGIEGLRRLIHARKA